MTPSEKILKKLGLTELALAKELGLDRSTIARWKYTKTNHGTGGFIPHKYHRQILDIAKSRGVELTASDFVSL